MSSPSNNSTSSSAGASKVLIQWPSFKKDFVKHTYKYTTLGSGIRWLSKPEDWETYAPSSSSGISDGSVDRTFILSNLCKAQKGVSDLLLEWIKNPTKTNNELAMQAFSANTIVGDDNTGS